jgi:hypothetical protein
MQPLSPFLGGPPIVSVASLAEMARGNRIAPSDFRTMIISVDNECGRSFQNTLLHPMFNLFDGKTDIIDNYDDNDKWLDACLGSLPQITDALVMVRGGISTEMGGSR